MKKTHIIAIVIIAIAIGAILGTVADSSTYASFSVAMKDAGKEFHIVAHLDKEKERIYNPKDNANLFIFYVKDNEGIEKRVLFNGTEPQDFVKSEQIVLTGKIKGEDFIADKILMKCPSKYNDKQPEMKEFKSAS